MSDSGMNLAMWEEGFLVRVIGRGTMQESPAFRETVLMCLQRNRYCHVVVDLSDCHYVDSTFMGGLIWLHKYAGELTPERLQFFADASKCRQLFSHSLLDRVLNFVDKLPVAVGQPTEISIEDMSREDLGRHIEQCHRQLSKLGGPDADTFGQIADRLRRELRD